MDGVTEGRVVHFVAVHGKLALCYAATITRVVEDEGCVNLDVHTDLDPGLKDSWDDDHRLFPQPIRHYRDVEYSEDAQRDRTWHWPERA